jgi:hypothetical protein
MERREPRMRKMQRYLDNGSQRHEGTSTMRRNAPVACRARKHGGAEARDDGGTWDRHRAPEMTGM